MHMAKTGKSYSPFGSGGLQHTHVILWSISRIYCFFMEQLRFSCNHRTEKLWSCYEENLTLSQTKAVQEFNGHHQTLQDSKKVSSTGGTANTLMRWWRALVPPEIHPPVSSSQCFTTHQAGRQHTSTLRPLFLCGTANTLRDRLSQQPQWWLFWWKKWLFNTTTPVLNQFL